jgi:hypothetical protein
MDVGWLLHSRQKLELTRHRRSDVSRSRKKLGGAPALLGLHPGEKFGHRTTWKPVVPGNFDVGTLVSKLLFFDAGAGRREFWTRYDGTMQLMAGIDGWRTDWDMIIPGHSPTIRTPTCSSMNARAAPASSKEPTEASV